MMNKWLISLAIGTISIITGVALTITSQLGERFNTTIVEQIQSGNPPIITFIGMGLMILPPVIIYIARAKVENK